MMMTIVAMTSILCSVTAQEFESHEYRYKENPFRYRLFVPRPLEAGKQYPLLVWLHGLGANGDNNQNQVNEAGFWLNTADGSYFILMLQCPSKDPNWSSTNIEATVAVLKKAIQERPIDADRVYLAGLSAGGGGCWEMAMRYPELFAAVVPLASGGCDPSRVKSLTGLPIWSFHNTGDTAPPPEGVKQTVAALTAVDGNVLLSLLPAQGHDCWSAATGKYGAISWMLEQRRGAPCWTPPGHRPWRWWHIAILPCSILAFVRLAWFLEQRRRSLAIAPESESTDADFSVGPMLRIDGPAESTVDGFAPHEAAGSVHSVE